MLQHRVLTAMKEPSLPALALALLALVLHAGCSVDTGSPSGLDSRGTLKPIVMEPGPNPPVTEAILTGIYVQEWPDRGYDRIVFELRDPQIPRVFIRYRQASDRCEGDPDLAGLFVLTVKFDASIAWDPGGDRTVGLSSPGGIVEEIKQLCVDGDSLVWGIIVGGQKSYRVSRGSVTFWTRLEGERHRRTVILEILH
jgi:hypothetical protein